MANSNRAPKQWSLSKQETINTFQNWKQNLVYTLSLDNSFSQFLKPEASWGKRIKGNPLRGFVDDREDVAIGCRRTAEQKVVTLELMLGQIANYCPILSRNTIVRNSTSLDNIWQAIRLHFGFQTTGGHFLDFNDIRLLPDERPEDLYQRLVAFVEDNLLTTESGITHHGECSPDEDLTPSLENFIVLTWLRLVHPSLPRLVKQRYGTELRSRTLASIKPEISQALSSLLDELQHSEDAKVMKASTYAKPSFQQRRPLTKFGKHTRQNKSCPICKQSGRPDSSHFLSECPFLPDSDRKFVTRARQIIALAESDGDSDDECSEGVGCDPSTDRDPVSATRRVKTASSPYIDLFCRHHTVRITLDCGATGNMIQEATALRLGAKITPTSQSAHQADGFSPLQTVGETRLTFSRDNRVLKFEGLVIRDLDVPVLAGVPFMESNDIYGRPATKTVIFGDGSSYKYGSDASTPRQGQSHTVRRATVIRAPPRATTIWPGEYLEVHIPEYDDSSSEFALEPHTDSSRSKVCTPSQIWPQPDIVTSLSGSIRIPNLMTDAIHLKRNEHFCQVRPVYVPTYMDSGKIPTHPEQSAVEQRTNHAAGVIIDPDNTLSQEERQAFHSLVSEFDDVFSPEIPGYNGSAGPFQATVNMGPVLPPQRKGRLPQYNKNRLVELQDKFDALEEKGVFMRPEDAGVNVEYVNPSFLVNKPNGGTRLVTAFADVGRYSKPQPSLLPDVDGTLRKVAQWKYIITSDLSSAFYQIPLDKKSMKFCGVVTPFKGVRVYVRSAMGMPGSETSLEEMLCRVLGELLKEGVVVKIADDLICGGDTISDMLRNWRRVLACLHSCDLRLSAPKTIVCPKTTGLLGWIWCLGTLSASPHRVAALSSCDFPSTVKGLRSFLGAYKILARVLPNCASTLAPLEDMVAGRESSEKLMWCDSGREVFQRSQRELMNHKSITLPKADDQLWIVTDGSTKNYGVGATLYVTREGSPKLAGFFSAKLRSRQVTWIPCEIEALAIALAVKHFSPYIIQSNHSTVVLTDSKPCVQAFEKLCRGEFSASPRVLTFLSTVSRYQASVRHLAGAANAPSDFASRNAPKCSEPKCQVCTFAMLSEDATVMKIDIQDVLSGSIRLPFASRKAWSVIQDECSDLRRVRAHLRQGTRPSKKLTNVKDVKRYLRVSSIASDGLLVVKRHEPLYPTRDSIIVPRQFLEGLLTALHIQLGHPTCHQLKTVFQRYFYALDSDRAIDTSSRSCHQCASLMKLPTVSGSQSSVPPPETVGISFAADVLKRNRQLILAVRETVTSYTVTMLVENERGECLRDALIRLGMDLRPLDGPPVVIRVDPAPGFQSLVNDKSLRYEGIVLEIGRVMNKNKNPVAEKAIQELEDELLRLDPRGGPTSSLDLARATARLNARLRSRGLSAREMWYQRDQFTNDQIPVSDSNLIVDQKEARERNHGPSERSKNPRGITASESCVSVGDVVYLRSERQKTHGRSRYLVTHCEGLWLSVVKFTGNQLRSTSYRIKNEECFKVPNFSSSESRMHPSHEDIYDDVDMLDNQPHLPHAEHQLPTPLQLSAVEPTRDEPKRTMYSSEVGDSEPAESIQTHEMAASTESVPPAAVDSSPDVRPDLEPPDLRRSIRSRSRPEYLKDYEL